MAVGLQNSLYTRAQHLKSYCTGIIWSRQLGLAFGLIEPSLQERGKRHGAHIL